MSAGELSQSHPVLWFLAPAGANAASFDQPTDGAFDHPATGGVTLLAGHRAFLDDRFIASAAMFDMNNIACLLNKLVDIIIIVTLVSAEMLFDVLGVWTFNNNRNNQIIRRPLVMLVRASDMQSQWRTSLVDQQVDFAAAFAAICGAFACIWPSQRRRTRLAIHRLPLPFDLPMLAIEANHRFHDPLKNALVLPRLEPFMQDTAAHPKPVPMNRFPLATRPQHIPNAIPHCSVIGTRTPRPSSFRYGGQPLLDLLPQFIRDFEIVHILRFCVSLVFQGISSLEMVFPKPDSLRICPFVKTCLIYG